MPTASTAPLLHFQTMHDPSTMLRCPPAFDRTRSCPPAIPSTRPSFAGHHQSAWHERRLCFPVNVRNAQETRIGTAAHSGRHPVVAAAATGFRRGRTQIRALKVDGEPLMDLSQGQSCVFHELPSGLRMEVIVQKAAREDLSKPPLVFVHGSYHAAWCWACNWLPYLSTRGYDCYAISLIGQGASDVPVDKASLSLQSHAEDVAHFIGQRVSAPPVLIGHSFGGLVIQWFLSRTLSTSNTSLGHDDVFPVVQAAALICSCPPTGNGPMVKRFIKRDPIASIQITLSLAAKLFGVSLSLCRKSFFSPDLPEDDLRKYQSLLKRSSRYPMLDLRKLNAILPLPKAPPEGPPVFVLSAENDFVVDREGAHETAEWYKTVPHFIRGCAHDIMLDTAWETGAEALKSWLERHARLQVVHGKYDERSAV